LRTSRGLKSDLVQILPDKYEFVLTSSGWTRIETTFMMSTDMFQEIKVQFKNLAVSTRDFEAALITAAYALKGTSIKGFDASNS
jgi:hypothetical protein